MFDGSAELLFASLLGSKKLSPEEIENLKRIVNDLK
jgi:predicted transcriptional regulator